MSASKITLHAGNGKLLKKIIIKKQINILKLV